MSNKAFLYARTLCCMDRAKRPGVKEAQIVRLFEKGKEKLREDFDVIQLLKSMSNLRILFKQYRLRHSDLMIEVNKSRKNVINLEDDDWEHELEKQEVYMTRFGTHQTSSDEDSDESEDESASRTSKKSKSQQRSVSSKSE